MYCPSAPELPVQANRDRPDYCGICSEPVERNFAERFQAEVLGATRNRQQELKHWLHTQLGERPFTLDPASNDASFRSYWRVGLGPSDSMIAMDAPPEKENSAEFIRIGRHLAAAGLHTPAIHEFDLNKGFVLMEDLGSTSYAQALTTATAPALYEDALSALATIANTDPSSLAPYEAQRFDDELDLFTQWLVTEHLQVELDSGQRKVWSGAKQALIDSALNQPCVFVHRDYHCRNLMVCPRHNPGVLDFQDALFGPITYDPVSLLRDCYIKWPETEVASWMESYRQRVAPLLPGDVTPGQWQQWFDWMGVQRHLKAAGIFARLRHRDGKPGYLADIPRTMSYVVEICTKYRQLNELGKLITGLPLALEQEA